MPTTSSAYACPQLLAADCINFDFEWKEVGLVDYLQLSGNVTADMADIRAILQPHAGCHPALASPIELRADENAAGKSFT
ncbi:MAG: hypothetical protein Q7T62_11825 [Undibacterium sp.]|nr:hypothetical protein [Undibacterium sp.]